MTSSDHVQSDDARRVSAMGAANARRAGVSIWPAIGLAIVLLVGAGVGYRVGAKRLNLIFGNPVKLPLPLAAIPMQVGDWSGKEQLLKSTTEDYMRANFADDYISRSYLNTSKRIVADLYVVFCSSRPAGLLGHKPDVCLPRNGFTLDKTMRAQVTNRAGQKIPCRIQQFHKPAPNYSERFVLSFYVVNGQITLSEDEFSGFWGRRPNLSGNLARYVAQVQISAQIDSSARLAATDLVDKVLTFLPDQNGRVKAISPPSDGL